MGEDDEKRKEKENKYAKKNYKVIFTRPHSHASFPSSAVRQIKNPCSGVKGPLTSIENESLPVLPNWRSTVFLSLLLPPPPPPSPPAATSWKFLTLGAVTRPPKSSVKAPAEADQRGETLASVSAEPSLAAAAAASGLEGGGGGGG